MNYIDEKQLIAALRGHRQDAWDWAVAQYSRDMHSLLYYLCGRCTDTAEVLSQEVWLEAVDHFSQFDPARGNLRGWLLGIARLRIAMHYRRVARRREVCDDTELVAASDSELLPDVVLAQLERADVVRAALIALPEDRRAVLQLKYVDGLSVDQIAAQTGKSSKSVESLLTRSRDQIRKLLRWYFPSTESERSHEQTLKQ